MTVNTAKQLIEHYGHNIEIVNYGDLNGYDSVTVECLDCNTVLYEQTIIREKSEVQNG